MILSPGRNFVFVHIPKTGGTSMALALEARAMADDILIGDTPKAVKRRQRVKKLDAPGRLWKHARLRDVDGMLEAPFVFTMVRNPWDRVVSLYHWAQAQQFEHPMVDLAKRLSFREFVFADENMRAFRQDAAEDYVTDRAGALRCDAFVRLEHLADDLMPVEAHLGFALEVPHVNRSAHLPTPELYDDETRGRIGHLFARDIDRFGYRFPDA